MGISNVKAGPGTVDLNEFVGDDPYFVLVFRSEDEDNVDMAVQLSANMMEDNNLDMLPNALLSIAQAF